MPENNVILPSESSKVMWFYWFVHEYAIPEPESHKIVLNIFFNPC